MKENSKKEISRREFIKLSALGLASLTILPSWIVNGVRIAPSDRVVLGFVGLGQQGLSDFQSFASCPGVQVAACCDVDSIKRERSAVVLKLGRNHKKLPLDATRMSSTKTCSTARTST